MRPLWKGAISFGLVTIPVSLYPATRREELTFRMLRKSDLSPINYKRVVRPAERRCPGRKS
jgi:DNA end-binding protein Ku